LRVVVEGGRGKGNPERWKRVGWPKKVVCATVGKSLPKSELRENRKGKGEGKGVFFSKPILPKWFQFGGELPSDNETVGKSTKGKGGRRGGSGWTGLLGRGTSYKSKPLRNKGLRRRGRKKGKVKGVLYIVETEPLGHWSQRKRPKEAPRGEEK